MDERVAFERAILAQPADDNCRLVFADWLQDRGEEDRANFIRVQVQLAQLGLAPSRSHWNGQGRLALEAQHRDLLNLQGELWGRIVGSLSVPAGLKEVGYQYGPAEPLYPYGVYARGFLEQVEMTLFDLLRIGPAVCQQNPVSSLNVMDRSPGGRLQRSDNPDHDAVVYWWDICEERDITRVSSLPGFLPDPIWRNRRISTRQGMRRVPVARHTIQESLQAMNAACLDWCRVAEPRAFDFDEADGDHCELCNGNGFPAGSSYGPCPECGEVSRRVFD